MLFVLFVCAMFYVELTEVKMQTTNRSFNIKVCLTNDTQTKKQKTYSLTRTHGT